MSRGALERGPNGVAKAQRAADRLREWGAAFARGDRIVVPILAAAAALRLWDLGRRSLWYDEAWAALGCLDGPFDVAHVGPTPVVFAALVRGSVAVLGRTEVAVRLPAALFSLGAVFLGYRLAREVVGRGGGMVGATLLGLLPIPVAYGKELKHYAAEVFLALAIASLTSRIRRAPGAAAGWVLLTLSVVLGSGLTALAPLLGAGALLILLPLARRMPLAYGTAAGVSGLAAAAWLRLVFTPQMATAPNLSDYWHLFFLPHGPPEVLVAAALRSAAEASTFGLGTWTPHLMDNYVRLAAFPPGITGVIVAAMLVGALSLVRRGAGWFAALVLAWHVLVAGAAFAGVYPYGPARIALVFLAPTALLLAAAAAMIVHPLPRGVQPLAWAVLFVPLAWPLAGTWRENVTQPYEYEELRPVLQAMFAQARATDTIWVSPGATYAFRFYVPRPDPRVAFSPPLTETGVFGAALRTALRQGNGRLWLVFSHKQQEQAALAYRALPTVTVLDRRVAKTATVVLVSDGLAM